MSAIEIPRLITKMDDVHRLVERVYQNPQQTYTYDFETLGTRVMRARIAGLGFGWGPNKDDGAYILTAHQDHPHLDWEKVVPVIKPLLEDQNMTQIAHNQCFDGTFLRRWDIQPHLNTYDTMVLCWLLNTAEPNGLKGEILRRYQYQMNELSQFAQKVTVSWHPDKIFALDKVDIETMREYAIDDVVWTYRLFEDQIKEIKADPRLDKLYHELYRETLENLIDMQINGSLLDQNHLTTMEREVTLRMAELVPLMFRSRPGQDFEPLGEDADIDTINAKRKEIPALNEKWKKRDALRPMLYEHPSLAHKVFNPNSGLDLNQILFKEMKLRPIGDVGDSGLYSVDADALLKLKSKDKTGLIEALLEYRQLSKILGTYLIGLREVVDDDGRVRSKFNPTLATGRLSSSEPNLQNIPSRNPVGLQVRAGFVSEDGKTLGVIDYSNIEVRLAAHMANEVGLIEAFLKGYDPHSATAKLAFGHIVTCEVHEVKKKFPLMRAGGKTLNFAILYQSGPATVLDQIIEATNGDFTPSLNEVKEMIENYFVGLPAIRQFIQMQKAKAKRDKLVRTILGRPRHLPEIDSPIRGISAKAERVAVNAPIQGSAADVMFLAMRNVKRVLTAKGLYGTLGRAPVQLNLQVHDELIYEIQNEYVDEVLPIIQREMENALKLRVPLIAEPGTGPNWMLAK